VTALEPAVPQYDEDGRRRFPVRYDLVGFTGSGLAHANWKPFGDIVPERAARLIREQKMGPAIIVFLDDDRLCVVQEDEQSDEPQIICSLGLAGAQK
jgi:hypothetical protein